MFSSWGDSFVSVDGMGGGGGGGGGAGEWRSRHFRSNWQFLFLAWYAAILSLSFLRYSSSFHPSFNLTVEYPNSHGYVQHLSSVVS